MDNLDRMYRHLVRTVKTKFPQYLTHPFDVAELHQTILPYRHHRREMGLDTNEDYELTLTELLTGARDYLIVDDRMRDVLRADLASNNPDPSAFKQFERASIALSPAALRSLEAGPDDPSTPLRMVAVPVEPASLPTEPIPVEPRVATPAAPRVTRPSGVETTPVAPAGGRSIVPEQGTRCRACDEVLPPGRPLTYCPHCGQNLTTKHCQACGSELELRWKFCPTCGRPADAK